MGEYLLEAQLDYSVTDQTLDLSRRLHGADFRERHQQDVRQLREGARPLRWYYRRRVSVQALVYRKPAYLDRGVCSVKLDSTYVVRNAHCYLHPRTWIPTPSCA
jgi:hypothetical protein